MTWLIVLWMVMSGVAFMVGLWLDLHDSSYEFEWEEAADE